MVKVIIEIENITQEQLQAIIAILGPKTGIEYYGHFQKVKISEHKEKKASKLKGKPAKVCKHKICPTCNKEFKPTSNRQIYCSNEHNPYPKKAKKQKEEINEERSPLPQQPPIIKKIDKLSKKAAITKICPECEREFIPTHPYKKYCSTECFSSAMSKRQKKYFAEKKLNAEVDEAIKEADEINHLENAVQEVMKKEIPEPKNKSKKTTIFDRLPLNLLGNKDKIIIKIPEIPGTPTYEVNKHLTIEQIEKYKLNKIHEYNEKIKNLKKL
jgi:hypothetical protein